MVNVHIGPMPPPIGGISIYLYRLSKIEKNSIFIDEKNFIGDGKYNLKLIKSLLYFLIWTIKQIFSLKKKNIVYHSHIREFRLYFYALSCVSIHKFSLVIHGQSLIDQYKKSNKIIRFLIRKMLKKANYVQVVNSNYKKFILSIDPKLNNLIVKKAFIPPVVEEEQEIVETYEPKLIQFFKKRKPIIASNAGVIRFYNKIDIYGLDLCVELTAKLKNDFPNLGFLFALANDKKEKNYLNNIKKRIKELKIEKNFYIMTGQKIFWPILKKIDLFIRPTFIDGSPLSLEEARYLNCPTLASDASPRSNDTMIFKNRDLDDLYVKCIDFLMNN